MVGKPYTQTPSFRSAINYLVLNPTWTVPPGMMKREYLPKILNDPGYLSSTGLKVYDTKGNQVNPATINWSRYLKRPCPYVLRQAAGKRNSLGRLKFLFPNPYRKFFIVAAMAAIGLNTHLGKLLANGLRPILMGLVCWVVLAGTSLIVQHFLGLL